MVTSSRKFRLFEFSYRDGEILLDTDLKRGANPTRSDRSLIKFKLRHYQIYQHALKLSN